MPRPASGSGRQLHVTRAPDGRPLRVAVGQTVGVHEWLVGGAVIEGPEGLLLVRNRRRDGSVDWTPPGGVIDHGESVVEGLAREVREETGLVVTRWAGLLYEIEAHAPDMGWTLRVEAWQAAEWEGEIEIADPDGIVEEARWVPSGDCVTHLEGGSPWVAEPVGEWLADRGPGSAASGTASSAPSDRRSSSPGCERHRPGRRSTGGPRRRRRSCTSTWTPSSCRSSCSTGPSCAASRWWSAATATGAWWPPRPTRPGPTACTRPCRRRRPAGCAPRRCSSPGATAATPR